MTAPIKFWWILTLIIFCGCIPQKQQTPCKEKLVLPPVSETASNIVVSVPSSDLQGIQKYIGNGNTITFTNETELTFGDTVLSASAGTNATYTNQGDSIVLVFGTPLPVVTVKQWGIKFHPKLERLTIEPDGSVSAQVNELGKRIVKEGVFRWATEQPKEKIGVSLDTKPKASTYSAPSPVLIPFSNTHWVETHTGSTSARHLVQEHGCPQWVADYYSSSPAMLTQIHSGYHERARGGSYRMLLVTPPEKVSVSSVPSSCPTGTCPLIRKR
jgi:hypothetical protein